VVGSGLTSGIRGYNRIVRPRPARLRLALQALVACYVLALAAMPFAHHDLACHLKSNTHCVTCHVGASADTGGADPALSAVALVEAGRAEEPAFTVISSPALLPSSGRSPPLSTL
jgi:mono/diheme cytochrome c family protein